MFKKFTFAAGVSAGGAIVVVLLAGTGKWPSAGLKASVQQWADRPSAGRAAGRARGAFRQAIARLSATHGAHDAAAGGIPASTGGVIPLETVPFDQLSEWELDLLTTPDS